MDKLFDIQDHWEKNGIYYIKTDYGELNSTSKKDYNEVVKDGFIIIQIEDEDWELPD